MPSQSKSSQKISVIQKIEPLIHIIRGQKVILDADLARVYGVPTKRLNEQVRRNRKKFPVDFIFQLTSEELTTLMSQFATSKESAREDGERSSRSQNATLKEQGMRSQFATASKRNVRHLPYAFTEQGAVMAANVLNSPSAVRMSIFVVRAFLQMRRLLSGSRDLARQLAELEKKLTSRLDVHESAIVDILKRIMELIDPPPAPPPPPKPPKPPIGFHRTE
jgi:hypothetical protein